MLKLKIDLSNSSPHCLIALDDYGNFWAKENDNDYWVSAEVNKSISVDLVEEVWEKG